MKVEALVPGGARAWAKVEAIAKALGDDGTLTEEARVKVWQVAITAWRAVQEFETGG